MKTINLVQVNNIYCQTDQAGRSLLAPCLSYRKSYWKQNQYRKEEMFYDVCLIERNGLLLTGFLPRILKYCSKNGILLNILNQENQPAIKKPNQKSLLSFLEKVKKSLGKEYRENQLLKQSELIKSALIAKRGILVSPTGTGKTTLALGIASAFPSSKILYVVHTKSLVTQTSKEFEKYGFKISRVMEGVKDQSQKIVVATRQSLINMKLEKYDVVMVDEVHRLSSADGTYSKILTQINAAYRFGFTATFEETKKVVKLATEGLIGKVVGELTMEKAQEMEILAKPKIKIIKIPKQFLESSGYANVYDEAVVFSKVRNKIIVKLVRNYNKENKIVFIIVTKVEHGKEICRIAKNLYDFDIPFIHGGTPSEERELCKQLLMTKKLKTVVTTVVWREGINIPALDVIVNASGGKDDLQIVQLIGRGLRLMEGKKEMTLVDFFDESSNYLIKHFGNRICLFSEKGWL